MIVTKCDKCGGESGQQNLVTIRGFTGLSGGITLPDRFQEKHFCGKRCFVEWLYEDAKLQDILIELGT